jgi:hypothetical protein
MNEVGKKSHVVNTNNEELENQEQRESKLIQELENYKELYLEALDERVKLNAKIKMLEEAVKSQAAYIASVEK